MLAILPTFVEICPNLRLVCRAWRSRLETAVRLQSSDIPPLSGLCYGAYIRILTWFQALLALVKLPAFVLPQQTEQKCKLSPRMSLNSDHQCGDPRKFFAPHYAPILSRVCSSCRGRSSRAYLHTPFLENMASQYRWPPRAGQQRLCRATTTDWQL
jgi:hypothetical protein